MDTSFHPLKESWASGFSNVTQNRTLFSQKGFNIYKCPPLDPTRHTFISINHLSVKGTDGVMKPFKLHLPFVLFSCYAPLVGCWHTTEPEEVSGGAV